MLKLDINPELLTDRLETVYEDYNTLRDYFISYGRTNILILALKGLLQDYEFNFELARNLARKKEGVTEEYIKEKFKYYILLTDSIYDFLEKG